MFTQEDLDSLNRAIASGILSVSLGNRVVTYRSIQDLISARNLVRQDLYNAKRKSACPSVCVPMFDDG